MEKLLYESKGNVKNLTPKLICCGIIMMLCSCGIMAIAAQSNLNESGQRTFWIVGIAIMAIGIWAICISTEVGKMHVKVFEHHIEGTNNTFVKRNYFYKFSDISGAKREQNVIILFTTYLGTKRIVVKSEEDAKKIAEIILPKIGMPQE